MNAKMFWAAVVGVVVWLLLKPKKIAAAVFPSFLAALPSVSPATLATKPKRKTAQGQGFVFFAPINVPGPGLFSAPIVGPFASNAGVFNQADRHAQPGININPGGHGFTGALYMSPAERGKAARRNERISREIGPGLTVDL